MLTPEENQLLCRVEGVAPMGQLFRRHWLPACLSEQVVEADGNPVRVKLLGEELVLFRDTDGRLGLIDEHCPHRRASLFYGRNEECGLRCLYHGWKFDVEGNCVEMASEPSESSFCDKVKLKSYPVHEYAGFVWTYMGPKETMPEFEPPVFAPTPETPVATSRMIVKCNWAQILEGAIDSAHSSSLHSSDMVPAKISYSGAGTTHWYRPSTDKSPRMVSDKTSFGFRYAALRRPIKDAATHDYVRTTLFIAPCTVHIPSNNLYNVALLHVPVDDHTTAFYFLAFGGAACPSTEEWRRFLGAQVGIDVDENYEVLRTRENNYKQDRQSMKLGNWTGIKGIPNQDIVMWETMGPIADRSADRLGASDLAIVEFRRIMVDAVKAFAAGGPAIGTTQPHIPQSKLRSFEGIVPKTLDWKTLGCTEEELAIRAQQAAKPSKQQAAE